MKGKRVLAGLIAIALLMIVSVITVSPAAAASLSADRSITGEICPGSTFTVTIDLDVTGSPIQGMGIYEDVSDLPSGWTITPHDGGVYQTATKTVDWVWFDTGGALGDQSVTYDVTIPGDAVISSSYDLTGEAYISSDGTVTTVDMGTDTVTVVDCGGVGDASLSADRSISGMICPGSTFTVTIDLDVTGSPIQGMGIYEDVSDLPSGWTITPHDGGVYQTATKTVDWVWFDTGGALGDQSVTYDVTIPGDAVISSSYDLTGEAYISSDGTVTTVDMGTDTVTVVDCGGVGDASLSADRSISGMICPGSTFTVTIDLDVTGSPIQGMGIYEDVSDLPSGWTITPHDGGVYQTATKTVDWVWFDTGGALGDQSVTYDVTIPGDAVISSSYDLTGEAYISSDGTVTTVDMGTDTVTVVDCGGVGDASLSADRSISGMICPGSTFTVTIDLDVTGSPIQGMGIYEDVSDLPSGWTITPHDGGVYQTATKTVDWVWFDTGGALGDQSVTYDVTIPGDAVISNSYDISGEAYISSDGTVTIVDMGTDTITVIVCNELPDVEVNTPNGGETLKGVETLGATATDSDGTIVSVKFYYSNDGGSTYTEVGDGTAASDYYTYQWDTTTVDDGTNYLIKAVATDDGDATDDDTSDAVFTVDNSCPCDFCLDLEAGWNLVSVPKRLDGAIDAETVFNITDPTTETCEYYHYDACDSDGRWLDLNEIDVVPCRGYWVYKVNAEMRCLDFKPTGQELPPSQQLCAGWNMIGHIDTSVMSIEDFGSATTIGDNLAQLWQWTQDDGWEGYPFGLSYMTPGQGYWAFIDDNDEMAGTL